MLLYFALSLSLCPLTGYQRQLTYLQIEGCFSIWTHSKCSVWLTAFTARFFIEAADPGTILPDTVHMNKYMCMLAVPISTSLSSSSSLPHSTRNQSLALPLYDKILLCLVLLYECVCWINISLYSD